MMKTTIGILAIILMLPFQNLMAQRRGSEVSEKIQSMKVAFFTEKLNLSPEQAETFWPLYNEYEAAKEKIHREKRSIYRNFNQNSDTLLESDVENMLKRLTELQESENRIAKEFQKKFLHIFPASKVMQIYITEFQFREFLLRELRNHKGKRGEPPVQ